MSLNTNYSNSADTIDNYDLPPPLSPDSNIHNLLTVLSSESTRIDLDLEQLYDNRFITSATGEELEKIGFEVGVTRREDESDERLRARIYGNYASQGSDTTYDTFAAAILIILDSDESAVDSITTPPDTQNSKVIEVGIDANVLSNSPLSQDEIIDILNDTVSADARVEITATGTFGFDGDEDNEGFDEGTWSSVIT